MVHHIDLAPIEPLWACLDSRDLGVWNGRHECHSSTGGDRLAHTLLPVMQRHLRPGTILYSDLWAAYNIQQLPPVAQHDIVNHSLNFVYPVTGVHMQNVESYWNRVETKFKRMKGVHADMLTSYMDEFVWRERHGTSASTVLANLCQDISLRYPQRDVLHSLSLPLFSLLNQLFYKLPTLQKIYL